MRIFNYENLESNKWDSEIINLLSQIHEHRGKQELFLTRKPAVLDKLVEIAKIQSVEDSNRIEGIVTTAVRIKELVNQKTTPRNRDEEEILGYRDVLNIIHESYEYIPQLTVIIFCNFIDIYISIVKKESVVDTKTHKILL